MKCLTMINEENKVFIKTVSATVAKAELLLTIRPSAADRVINVTVRSNVSDNGKEAVRGENVTVLAHKRHLKVSAKPGQKIYITGDQVRLVDPVLVSI